MRALKKNPRSDRRLAKNGGNPTKFPNQNLYTKTSEATNPHNLQSNKKSLLSCYLNPSSRKQEWENSTGKEDSQAGESMAFLLWIWCALYKDSTFPWERWSGWNRVRGSWDARLFLSQVRKNQEPPWPWNSRFFQWLGGWEWVKPSPEKLRILWLCDLGWSSWWCI